MKTLVTGAVKVVVCLTMGVMVHEFTEKHVGEPLQKFMDSLAEKKGK